MAVVAIVSILTVIVLAVYGDYAIRSKVSEGMAFVGEARTSVSEYYYNKQSMPGNNSQAGLSDPDEYNQFEFIKRLEVSTTPTPGTITVTFKLAGTIADNKKMQLIPSTSGRIVYWTCLAAEDDGVSVNHVPPNCRG